MAANNISLIIFGVVVVAGKTMITRRCQAAAGLVVGVIVVVAGCDSGTASHATPAATHRDVSTSSPTPSTSTTSPAGVAQRKALVAYLGMWHDFVAAARNSAWHSPTLSLHATGLALSTLSRGLYADHYNGLVTKGSPTHSARAISANPRSDPTRVIVNDCSDSTYALKYRADNGQPAHDSPGGRRQINATVEKQSDGSWRVSDFGVQAVGTC